VKINTVITDSRSYPNAQDPDVLKAVEYRSGNMRRKDSLEPNGVTVSISQITNCGSRIGYLVDMDSREYRTFKVVRFAPIEELQEYMRKNPRSIVPVESKTIDTGDRKTFFGHPAKHFITTTKPIASGNNKRDEEIIDGWYIDHEPMGNQCEPDYAHTEPFYALGTSLAMPPEIAEFHHSGPIPSGLAVKLTITTRKFEADKASDRTITLERTVNELSDAPISSSVFEVPSGFHENPQLLRGKSVPVR
jgi:hypothetical protein